MDDTHDINESPRGWAEERRFHHGHHHGRRTVTRDEEPRRGKPPFRRGRGRRFGGDDRTGSFFGRGGRAARGDIRSAILVLLGEAPMHGYQIIAELNERSGGAWKPSPGSVYPTLQHMEDEGLVQHQETDGRNVYTLTEAGQSALAARAGQPAPWEEVASGLDRELFELRDLVGQVAVAARQIAHVGTRAQVAAAKTLLTDARRSLYRILAEDGADPEQAGRS
jgi:DNA-binding PadR family transcriptional regulator